MSKSGLSTLVLLLFLGLVAFTFQINPSLLSRTSALDAFYSQQNQSDFFTVRGFAESEGPAKTRFIYRGNLQRTGWGGEVDFKGPLKVTWTVPDLMGTIHTASKATPAVDQTGIYVGTDLGLFYKFSHSGEEIWRFRMDAGPQGIHGTALLDEDSVYIGTYAGWLYKLRKDSGDLIWATRVAHAIGSSPLLLNEKLIFSAEFGFPREGYLVALNAQTGKKIWTSPFFEEQVHSSPSFSPEQGVLGVGSNNGVFWGIDLQTGQVRWKYHADLPIKGTAIHYQGQFCFASWSQKLHCISDVTGEEMMTFDLQGSSQSSAALDPETDKVYLSSASGELFEISLKTKKILTKFNLKMENPLNRFSVPSPVLLQTPKFGRLILSACDGTAVCVFKADGLKLLQKIQVGGTVTGTFSIYGSSVFLLVDSLGLVRLD